jgi:hypothetical protein
MTPAEKAKELVDRYKEQMIENEAYFVNSGARHCALIAVDLLLNLCWGGNKVGVKYWSEVKQEIEKL